MFETILLSVCRCFVLSRSMSALSILRFCTESDAGTASTRYTLSVSSVGVNRVRTASTRSKYREK